MPAWTALAAELGVHERTLRRGHATGWVRASRSSYRDWFIGEDERLYLTQHWELLTALRRSLRNTHRSRLAVLAGPAARRDYDGEAVPVILASVARRTGTQLGLGRRLTDAAGRRVEVIALDEWALRSHGAVIRDARLFSRVLRDPDQEWRRWQERTRSLGPDGRVRPSELRPPDRYVIDEELFTEDELVRADRADAGEPDPLRCVDPF